MALLNTGAIAQLGDAYFFRAAVSTALPAKTARAAYTSFEDFETAGWQSYGATKLDALATINREGTEPESVGVWQLPTYFTKPGTMIESIDFDLAEWTVDAVTRFLGSNADVDEDTVAGSTSPTGTREAFLMAIKVADGFFGIYVDEAEVLGRASIELGERGSIPTLPIRATAKSASGYGFRFWGLKTAPVDPEA